jgi:hypothetical protein
MCQNSAFDWGKPEIEWTAIPDKEMVDALAQMRSRSTAVFDGQSDARQEEIIKNRLYQKRRNWRHQARKKRSESQDLVDGASKGNDAAADELGRIIQQQRHHPG